MKAAITDHWLADIVVVNESKLESVAGDVSIYRSVGEACRALEYWWIEGGYGHVFTASGDRLILSTDRSGNVLVQRRDSCLEGPAIVRGWLESSAHSVLQARTSKAAKGKAILSRFEERQALPVTIEGLIGYVGFDE